MNTKSPTADLLVEAALMATSSPTVLVVDSVCQLGNFRGESGKDDLSPATAKCIKALQKIKAAVRCALVAPGSGERHAHCKAAFAPVAEPWTRADGERYALMPDHPRDAARHTAGCDVWD